MASLQNLAIEVLKMLAKARGIDGYENMSRQQLESIFTTPSFNPILNLNQDLKNVHLYLLQQLLQDLKNVRLLKLQHKFQGLTNLNLRLPQNQKNLLAHPKIKKRLQGPSTISILNTKVKVINNYQSKNTVKTLDHIYVI